MAHLHKWSQIYAVVTLFYSIQSVQKRTLKLQSGSNYSIARPDVCYPEDYVRRCLKDTNLYGITQQE